MKSAKAFAPANISCIFKIYDHKDPRWMGSYGIGFTLHEGVTVDVSLSETDTILFNNKRTNIASVNKVTDFLTKESVTVRINSALPLGGGFGLSGASALATAYATNKLLDLKKSHKELAMLAHIAEVVSKTGLGDITNQYYGGLLIKFKPSSEFVIEKLPFDMIPVYCTYFSKLSTKSVITNADIREKINMSAEYALEKVKKLLDTKRHISFGEIISLSKEFAVDSGLLTNKKVIEAIQSIEKNNGHASMIMLGNAVFSDIPFPGAIKLTISDKGAQEVL